MQFNLLSILLIFVPSYAALHFVSFFFFFPLSVAEQLCWKEELYDILSHDDICVNNGEPLLYSAVAATMLY